MMAVRFSDMQGKSHWMAISPYFFSPSLKKGFPGCRPPAWRFHWQFTKQVGGSWGRSRRGRFGGTGLSSRGGSLQGLPQWYLSPTGAGGGWGRSRRGSLPRRGPPRSFSIGREFLYSTAVSPGLREKSLPSPRRYRVRAVGLVTRHISADQSRRLKSCT